MRHRPWGQIWLPTATGGPDDQTPSLLDVQLDEGAYPTKSFRVAADQCRISTRGSHGVRHADPVGIGQHRARSAAMLR